MAVSVPLVVIGAGTGFLVSGPVGAAIGAAAGGFLGKTPDAVVVQTPTGPVVVPAAAVPAVAASPAAPENPFDVTVLPGLNVDMAPAVNQAASAASLFVPVDLGDYGAVPVTAATIAMWGAVGLATWWLLHRMHYV